MHEPHPHARSDSSSQGDSFLEAAQHVQALWRHVDVLPWHATDPEKRQMRQRVGELSRELFVLLRELSTAYTLDEAVQWGGEPVRIGHTVDVGNGRGRIIAMTPCHAVVATPGGVVVRTWDEVSTGEGAAPPQPDPAELINHIAEKIRTVMQESS